MRVQSVWHNATKTNTLPFDFSPDDTKTKYVLYTLAKMPSLFQRKSCKHRN